MAGDYWDCMDPVLIEPGRITTTQRECALLCQMIRQAFTDADYLGRGARLMGSPDYKSPDKLAYEHREATRELREWMYAPRDRRFQSLEFILDAIETSSGVRIPTPVVRDIIDRCLAGDTPAGLVESRFNLVTRATAKEPRVYPSRRERRARREAREVVAA